MVLISYLHRYLVVCNASSVVGREKKIGHHILKLVVYFSIGIGVASFAYSDSIRIFLMCMGKEERFKFNMENIIEKRLGGVGIQLEFFHPFRLSFNIAIFSFAFVVPILYYRIFKFRKKQDSKVQGI